MFFVLFLFTIISSVWAKGPDLCDLIDLPNCSGVTHQSRRASSQSLPSPATASNLNPATVSFDRGFGIEAIYQNANPVQFSVAGGSGKVGGALISTSLENSFFGNRVVELDDMYADRVDNKKQYRAKKLSLAFGAKLYRKKHFGLDIGVMVKRHPKLKDINPGAGLSATLGPLTFGASVYRDDFLLLQSDALRFGLNGVYALKVISTGDYQEKFTVQTYTAGLRFWNLAFDAGVIQTRYKEFTENSRIQLLSGSMVIRNFMINVASRTERSQAPKFVDGALKYEKNDSNMYYGLQCSLGKHLILGVAYNYYLLHETSLNASLFY